MNFGDKDDRIPWEEPRARPWEEWCRKCVGVSTSRAITILQVGQLGVRLGVRKKIVYGNRSTESCLGMSVATYFQIGYWVICLGVGKRVAMVILYIHKSVSVCLGVSESSAAIVLYIGQTRILYIRSLGEWITVGDRWSP